jgi:hypothetical protein|tara:strand:+ start:12438 stop:12668 length:231 start_codon:yes stop_codon:yes gene_type:complete
LRIPLKNVVYEKISQKTQITDLDLIKELNKEGWNVSMINLNKVLLNLEILGLIFVRWIGKDSRRIEVNNTKSEKNE